MRSAREPGRRLPPLITSPERRDLVARLLDPEHMLAVFQRELPGWCDVPVHVTRCSVKPAKSAGSRKTLREGQQHLVYTVGFTEPGGAERELVLLGVAPVGPSHLDLDLGERSRSLQGHAAVTPFRSLSGYVAELEMTLVHALLDPALPALGEVTGPRGPALLAAYLPECRDGARIERLQCELRHYKPLHRAVLRVEATLEPGAVARGPCAAYVKLFADGRGLELHRGLEALWSVARLSSHLRVPRPLGYDPGLGMLVMAEAPGGRELARWIRRLEQGESLPAVELARLERALEVVARALVELQRSGLRPRERRAFRDELERLEKDRGSPPEPGWSELAGAAAELLRLLRERAPRGERLVPAHGGLRHKQIVGDESSLTLIDWDGLCLANPALDAATFLARLREEPTGRPGEAPELERLAQRFRAEFLAGVPECARHLALYEALLLTERVLRSFRRASRSDRAREAAALRNRIAAARHALAGAEA